MECNEEMSLDKHPENCKIYTPQIIAHRMIKKLNIDWDSKFKLLEPAVGSGNIFLEVIGQYLEKTSSSTKRIKHVLETQFTAFDIDEEALEQLITALDSLVYEKKKIKQINWDIRKFNILETRIQTEFNESYDYIICNPPYINIRQLNKIQRDIIRLTPTCTKGNINIYYYFLYKTVNWLIPNGNFAFIVPNGILNNKSGKDLRKFLLQKGNVKSIENYPDDEVFKNALVKTCIISFEKKYKENAFTVFTDVGIKDNSIQIKDTRLFVLSADNFHFQVPHSKRGMELREIFDIEGGIATLEDSFYIIKPHEIISQNNIDVIEFKKNEMTWLIERELIRNAFRPNKNNEENYIIFPYKKDLSPIDIDAYPLFKNYYLQTKQKKGYTYGRKQSISHIDKEKIVLAKIAKEFRMNIREDCLVLSGISLVLKDEYIKNKTNIYTAFEKNLSRLFVELASNSKAYGSGYYNISTSNLKKLYLEFEE